jgi:hypothetical protein
MSSAATANIVVILSLEATDNLTCSIDLSLANNFSMIGLSGA